MAENILVVEYEPRYTDRVRQALTGQPFAPTFARDGEEAMRALEGQQPRLIVLSSVVPKISTTELIRAIRGHDTLQNTPILLTVSGYNGKSPKIDAQRVGASDILPKPYSEHDFLGKVQQMLGVRSEAPPAPQLTSDDIFGDLEDETKPQKKAMTAKTSDDVDKMLADTLAGMMPSRKTSAGAPAAKPRPAGAADDFEKKLQDTLSGLEKGARKTVAATPRPAETPAAKAPAPAPKPVAPAATAPPKPAVSAPVDVADRVPVAQPVFQPATAKAEEAEPTDGTRFGQYVLVEKIATGGMAEVWKARMRGVEGFQKIVAIKKILPHLSDNQDFVEMFVDEAKLAAQLNHNNIIHIYDLGKIQSSYYIAMEYIDGFDLKTILRRGEENGQPIGVELALFIASKVASALDYAHRKKDFEEKEMGLVHRDVSPQNVLISQEGDIKLCDFGIAKAASKASHTQAGALKGKLQYMSPEQAWGRNIDRRSDIFALATVLFEMLTGRKLFTGDNELSILEQVREARVQPPSLYNDDVTPEIDKIVLKALQKDPDNRYDTAGEMARDLDAVLYSFRPTPTSADLAIYMHRISSDEPAMSMPQADPSPLEVTPPPRIGSLSSPGIVPAAVPVPAPAPAPAPAAVAPAIAAPLTSSAAPAPAAAIAYDADEPKKSKTGLIAIAAAVVIIAGGAAFLLTRKSSPTVQPATTSSAAASSTAQPAAVAAIPLTATTATTATTGTQALTATTASIDPSLVDQEVQKRLAAERARLEQQARAQQAAATATQAPAQPAPAPAQVAQQTPPPAAVQQQETRPAPAPAQQEAAAAPQVVESRPAPQQPAVQRAREGDLVPAGTAGLVPPRIVRRGSVPYPGVARMQKIEGTVVTSVLVSESGQVLDVKILRGVNRPGGLNEAAEQTMRRSSFAPGMKDGVRVRSWITVPVEFKL